MRRVLSDLSFCEVLESRRLLADFSAAINFQPESAEPVEGMAIDVGLPFGERSDGLSYGWDQDVSRRTRSRASSVAPDTRYETFIAPARASWNLQVPNGIYTVHLVSGDGKTGRRGRFEVEGVVTLDGKTSKAERFLQGYATVEVTDGTLTVSPLNRAKDNRLNFIEVRPGPPPGQTFDGEPAVNRPGDVTGLFTLSGRHNRTQTPLTDGTVLDLSKSAGNIAISATTTPPNVGSVVFALNGVPFRTVNASPYSAGGTDAKGIPLPISLPDGAHTLTATAYAGLDGRGAAGTPMSVAFSVAGSPVVQITPSIAWVGNVAPVPQTRVEGGVVHLGTKVYHFGGYTDGFDVQNTSDVFDAATNLWAPGPEFPGAQTHAGMTSDGSRYIYKVSGQLGGGVPGTPVTEAFVFDTRTGQWSDLPAVPEARYAAGLAHVDGKLYLIGGTGPDRTTVVDTNWMLDLRNTSAGWQPRAVIPEAGDHPSVAVIDGLIYVIGGEHGHAATFPESDAAYIQHTHLYRYDPATDTWEELADLPLGRSHAEGQTVVANGKILFMGGKLNPTDVSDQIDLYDPANNTWTTLETVLPRAYQGGAAIYHEGRIFLSHGQRGAPDYTMWKGTWVGYVSGV
jgi:hypothetical protein